MTVISLEPTPVGAGGQMDKNPFEKEMENKANRAAKTHATSYAKQTFTKGAAATKKGAVDFKNFVVENPDSLKAACLIIGLCLIVFSILGIVNVFNIGNPLAYAVSIFNMVFGLVIVIVEGRETWTFFGLREKVFKYFGFLGHPIGRAFFYFYVGTMVICTLPEKSFWKITYIIMGSCLAVCGIAQILRYFCWTKQESKRQELDEPLEGI